MILDKYKGKTKDNRLLPVLSNQKINAYLKEIADLCGIKKRLSYHLARHTFATMLLSKGVPIESVSKMLGHTNIKTTQIYARITNKKIEQDMMQVADKFDGFKTVSSINRLASVQSLLRGKRPVTPLPSRIIPTGRYGFSILYLSSCHFYPSECCRNRLPEITSTNASVTSFHIKTKVFFTSHNANRSITRISQSANRISKPIRMQTGNIYIRSKSSNMVICFSYKNLCRGRLLLSNILKSMRYARNHLYFIRVNTCFSTSFSAFYDHELGACQALSSCNFEYHADMPEVLNVQNV